MLFATAGQARIFLVTVALGALLGLAYMALGVGLYALLSGQQLPFTAYLSDLAMGVAGGGIAGAILSRS